MTAANLFSFILLLLPDRFFVVATIAHIDRPQEMVFDGLPRNFQGTRLSWSIAAGLLKQPDKKAP